MLPPTKQLLRLLTLAITSPVLLGASIELPDAKPVPRAQAIPLPHHQISLQRDGIELTRLHFDPADLRPFVHPVLGPAGRSLTRMGHPHDPVTHSHHNSLCVPDAGTNLAFALPFATGPEEVCALEGHIVRAGRRPRRAGSPAFGAPDDVGGAVLAAMRVDRRFRSALNLRYSKPLVELCRTLGLKIGTFDRKREPKDSDSTIGWGVGAAVSALGFVPDVIFDEGAHGAEPMLFLLGENPQQVVEKVQSIVRGLKER